MQLAIKHTCVIIRSFQSATCLSKTRSHFLHALQIGKKFELGKRLKRCRRFGAPFPKYTRLEAVHGHSLIINPSLGTYQYFSGYYERIKRIKSYLMQNKYWSNNWNKYWNKYSMQNKYSSKYWNKYWNKYSMQNKYFLLHDCVIWRVRLYFMACANTTIVTVKRSLTIIVVKRCKRFPNYPLLATICVCTSLYLYLYICIAAD